MKTLLAFVSEESKIDDNRLNSIQDLLNQAKSDGVNIEDLSDGHHSFEELYQFRLMYQASLFNEWFKQGKFGVHKSRLHNDGEKPFGKDNLFIVAAMLDGGLISNHYDIKEWDLFKCEEAPKQKFKYDGHTSQDVLNRIKELIENEK